MDRAPVTGGAWRSPVLALALYGHHGLTAGFLLTALPAFAAARGEGVGAVGAHLAVAGLPWVLQPLWGPLVDRAGGWRMGRRRFWVVLALAGALLSLALMAAQSPEPLAGLRPFLLLHGAFAALLDTAADGWLIDRTPARERGRVTALTRVGFVGGGAVSAAIGGAVLPLWGFGGAMLLVLGGCLVLAIPPLLIRERAGDAALSWRRCAAPQTGLTQTGLTQTGLTQTGPAQAEPTQAEPTQTGPTQTGPAPALARELLRALRAGWPLLLFGALFEVAATLLRVPLAVFLVQGGGWTAPALSAFQGAAHFAAGTAGALGAGWLADRLGPARALRRFLLLAAAAHALFALGALGGAAALAAASVLSALCFVALAPAAMRQAAGPLAASRFALFMAALNAGEVGGSALAPALSAALGLPGVAALAAMALVILAVSARRVTNH